MVACRGGCPRRGSARGRRFEPGASGGLSCFVGTYALRPVCTAPQRGTSACGSAAQAQITQTRSLERLPRGEYQVPDQAQQAEREGSRAQQGRQVVPEDLGAQVP